MHIYVKYVCIIHIYIYIYIYIERGREMSHCSLWPWFSTQKAVLDSLGRWEIPTENHRSQWGLKNPRPFAKTERTVYSLYIVYWDIFRCIMDIMDIMDIMEWICQGCCRNADSRRGIFWKVLSESARLTNEIRKMVTMAGWKHPIETL